MKNGLGFFCFGLLIWSFNLQLQAQEASLAHPRFFPQFPASTIRPPFSNAPFDFHQSAASAPSDVNWDSRFTLNGTNNIVFAVAANDKFVYIGGGFTEVNGAAINNIARWDGQNWTALGGGVNGEVADIEVIGNEVYVGGAFTQAGGVSVNYIAKWDGAKWSRFGNGVAGAVTAIAVNGQELYAAAFVHQSETGSVLKWNGSSWLTLLKDNSRSLPLNLTFKDNTLYASGFFQNLAGKNINYLARWNGTAWLPVGNGNIGGGIYALAVTNTEILIGGVFAEIDGLFTRHVARWNGSRWLGIGNGKGLNAQINAMAINGKDIYVGGVFTTAGPIQSNYIAKWNGQDWQDLKSGNLNGFIEALVWSGNYLYAGGDFTMIGDIQTRSLAGWDGQRWSALGDGLNRRVFALAANGRDVYVGGDFDRAGGVIARHIAKWDGSSWSALGSGTNGWVTFIAVDGNNVYVGGEFTTAGGRDVPGIARWDGNDWHPLSNQTFEGRRITGLMIKDRAVYVAGLEAYTILKWDGTKWSRVGTADRRVGPLHAMQFVNNDLFVSGAIYSESEVLSNGIARWDGSDWWPLGSGLPEGHIIKCLGAIGNELFAGGFFQYVGGKLSMHFAHWSLPPRVKHDAATTDEEQPVTLNVLANDTEVGRGIAVNTVTISQPAGKGAAQNYPDGRIIYKPLANLNGTDVFKYYVKDRQGYISNEAKVTITIRPLNDPPGTFSRLQPVDRSIIKGDRVSFVWSRARNVDADTIAYFLRMTVKKADTTFVTRDTSLTLELRHFQPNPDTTTVRWRMTASDGRLTSMPMNGSGYFSVDIRTGVEVPSASALPKEFALHQNYPNPLRAASENAVTTLRYDLPTSAEVKLEILDLMGKKICALVEAEQPAGVYKAQWNGRDDFGAPVNSGIYFYRLTATSAKNAAYSAAGKLLLIR